MTRPPDRHGYTNGNGQAPVAQGRNGSVGRPVTPPAQPAVRTTNAPREEFSGGGVLPPEPPHSAETEQAPPVRFDDQRFFAPEDPPGGCATGECLPGEEEEFKLAMPSIQATASQDRWRQAVDRVREKSTRHGTSLSFGRLVYLKPGAVGIAYPADAGFHKSIVMTGTGRQTVEAALSEFFGEPTKLVLEEAPELTARAAVSLAEQDQQSRAAHEKSTEAKVRTHAAVRAVMKALGGELEHITVLEKEKPAPVAAAAAAAELPEDLS